MATAAFHVKARVLMNPDRLDLRFHLIRPNEQINDRQHDWTNRIIDGLGHRLMAAQGKAVNLVIAPSQLLAAECIPSVNKRPALSYFFFLTESFEF
jgi:hypothetical protein